MSSLWIYIVDKHRKVLGDTFARELKVSRGKIGIEEDVLITSSGTAVAVEVRGYSKPNGHKGALLRRIMLPAPITLDRLAIHGITLEVELYAKRH